MSEELKPFKLDLTDSMGCGTIFEYKDDNLWIARTLYGDKVGAIHLSDCNINALLPHITPSPWISVEDRLPEHLDWVLVHHGDGEPRAEMGFLNLRDEWRDRFLIRFTGNVTHWQPIELPK